MDVDGTPKANQLWQHTLPDARTRRELAALNDRFLQLIRKLALAPTHAADSAEPADLLGLNMSLAAQVANLPAARRRELAACPYTLVGVGLGDLGFWRALGKHQSPTAYRRTVTADHCSAAHAAAQREVLFSSLAYAWHLAHVAPIPARWMLGANAEGLALLAALPFSTLGQVADECPGLLRARLADHKRFWEDLISAAASPSKQGRFAAVSLGLQLSAAAGASHRSDSVKR